jgi:hypothetical protein
MSRTCADCMTVLKNEDNIYGIFQQCICPELNNSLLVWSVLTYGAGFINWWIYKNECGYCQSHANILVSDEHYQNHIVDMKTIQMIINANTDILEAKNANGDTILTIIEDVINFIEDAIKTYEKSNTDKMCNEIIIGKKHINELSELRSWIMKRELNSERERE